MVCGLTAAFPEGGCFSQGVLARRQGSNKDSCKLWRRAPSQHGTAGVSCRHSSLSYHVPPSPGQVTGVSPINPAPWWPLIGTPGFPSPPPSSLGTCFSPVHLLLNLCSQHPRHCWELVAVTQIYPLNQGSGHPLAWSSPEDVPAWSPASGCVAGGGLQLLGRALGLGTSKGFSVEGLGSSRRVFRWVLGGMAQDGDGCCCFFLSL